MQQLDATAAPRLLTSTSRRASAESGGAVLDPSSIAALLKSAEAALAADDAVQCLSATASLHRISLEHSASTRRRSLESSSTISSSSSPPPTISSTLGHASAIDTLLALAAAPNLSVRAEALGVLWNLAATTAGQEAVGADAPRTALVAALAAATDL